MPTYIRLTEYRDSDSKEEGFFKPENRYEANQEDFEKIPGSPIAYWITDAQKKLFDNDNLAVNNKFSNGFNTGDNEKYLRMWSEINNSKLGLGIASFEEANLLIKKWFPYNKGGGFQKWYGNDEYVINWEDDGAEIKEFAIKRNNGSHWSRYLCGMNYQFQKSITWSFVSSANFGIRFKNDGYLFDVGGSSMFVEDKNKYLYYGAFLNTKISFLLLKNINPTLNFQTGNIGKIPILITNCNKIKNNIDNLAIANTDISKKEWDSRETSWDFTKNELIKHKSDSKIETAYSNYCNYWRQQHNTLHQNEEELNRLFIDIYELQDELTPEVELKDITMLKQESHIDDNGELVFNADEIMKQFVSYGVGVMFGRYSLDTDGLIVANMGQEIPTDTTFEIDDDNVIPVLEDDYFKDDIASRFVQFVKTTFGDENLSENIRFIESSLGTTIRKYFVKGFYDDHIKRYKKRPIYWMVASPKKGFMSLIYMHRYQSDIFARVRNSYLTEYITKLEAHKDTLHLTTTSDTASDKDKKDADKRMKDIDTKLKELIAFDRDTMMSYAQNNVDIDLDDGVKVNYSKFQEILYEIKGLNKDE